MRCHSNLFVVPCLSFELKELLLFFLQTTPARIVSRRRVARGLLSQLGMGFQKWKPGVLEFFAKHSRQIEVFSLPPKLMRQDAGIRLLDHARPNGFDFLSREHPDEGRLRR
jgi:hypothetical protein